MGESASLSLATKLEQAIRLRTDNKLDEALKILSPLHKGNPRDPDINFQMAWTLDVMGKEREAVSHYEVALANGLRAKDRQDALLGLGSTYRCLGEYQKSLAVLDRAINEFPDDRSFKVFRALTLYNLRHYRESVSSLLLQLIQTTSDPSMKKYEKALTFYSDKLDKRWP